MVGVAQINEGVAQINERDVSLWNVDDEKIGTTDSWPS